MSKPLDKMLKNELVTLVNQLQTANHELGSKCAQLLGDKDRMREDITNLTSCVEDLESKLAALEERRRFESIAYRKKIRTANPDSFAARSAKKKDACARFFADNPEARSATPEDLAPYLEARS